MSEFEEDAKVFAVRQVEEEEGHYHHCQQCDKRVGGVCFCSKDTYMTWCSSNCRAAYDL